MAPTMVEALTDSSCYGWRREADRFPRNRNDKLRLLRCSRGLPGGMQNGLTEEDLQRISKFLSASKYERRPEMLTPDDE